MENNNNKKTKQNMGKSESTQKKQKEIIHKKKFRSFKYLIILIILLLILNVYFLVKEFTKFDFIDFVFTGDFNDDVSPDIEIEDTKDPLKEDELRGEVEEKTKQIEAIEITLEYESTGDDTFVILLGSAELNSENWQEDMKQKLEKYEKTKTKIIRVKNSGDIPFDIIEPLKEINKLHENILIIME